MDQRNEQLKREWDDRGERLGCTKRAVLFKRFPGWLNQSIHRRHARYILANLPAGAADVLDVGCGYGRIMEEIKRRHPSVNAHGIELCEPFAKEFERRYGPCFNGPLQDFDSPIQFDAIVMVTILMYLKRPEIPETLARLWGMVKPGGRLICIDSAVEIGVFFRRFLRPFDKRPTGGGCEQFLALRTDGIPGRPDCGETDQPGQFFTGARHWRTGRSSWGDGGEKWSVRRYELKLALRT